MRNCEFCNATFQPRPQVKRPRACASPECQKKRQSRNEKDWRDRHGEDSAPFDFKAWRSEKKKRLEHLAKDLSDLLKKGATFMGRGLFDQDLLGEILLQGLYKLGLRAANKLWPT